MLQELHIKNFVIIEDEHISFAPGLNVISGETGSGKSMLLQALELILGARPKGQYVRSGTDGWEVEALFDLSFLDERLRASLPAIVGEEKELLLMRGMNSAGRGKIYINGRLGTVSLLEEIALSLVNICGQGQQVRLLEPSYHLELLDGFAANDELLECYRGAYVDWQAACKELEEAAQKQKHAAIRRAELENIFEELKKVEVRAGIRAELENIVRRMANAEGILAESAQIGQLLNDEGGIYEQFSKLIKMATGLSKLDEGASEVEGLADAALEALHIFEAALSDYVSSIDVDQKELDSKRDHLAEVARLERKYRCSDADLAALKGSVEKELNEISDPESFERLRSGVDEKKKVVSKLADELSGKRKKAAASLAKQVVSELKELNMPEAKLEVVISEGELTPSGKDRLEMMISTNKGEPCKPLRSVASGGELSRIMLVLKKILRDRSGVNVLIFDEVDSGISGSVARAVGDKLKSLSEHSQVLCITHLAQVASLGDHHLLVEKVVGERTKTKIREISGDERVNEIARMLAGYKITAATRESAKELLGL